MAGFAQLFCKLRHGFIRIPTLSLPLFVYINLNVYSYVYVHIYMCICTYAPVCARNICTCIALTVPVSELILNWGLRLSSWYLTFSLVRVFAAPKIALPGVHTSKFVFILQDLTSFCCAVRFKHNTDLLGRSSPRESYADNLSTAELSEPAGKACAWTINQPTLLALLFGVSRVLQA